MQGKIYRNKPLESANQITKLNRITSQPSLSTNIRRQQLTQQ